MILVFNCLVKVKSDTWCRVNILQWVDNLWEARVPVNPLSTQRFKRKTKQRRRRRPVHAACRRSGTASEAGRGFLWARSRSSCGQNLRRRPLKSHEWVIVVVCNFWHFSLDLWGRKPPNRSNTEPNRNNHHVWLQRALLLSKSDIVLLYISKNSHCVKSCSDTANASKFSSKLIFGVISHFVIKMYSFLINPPGLYWAKPDLIIVKENSVPPA